MLGLVAAGLLLSPGLEAPRSWALLGLTVVASGFGAHLLVRSHQGYRYYLRQPAAYFYWITPACLTLGGATFTLQFLGGPFTWAGMLATGAGVALVLYCQYLLAAPPAGRAGPGAAPPPQARLIVHWAIYLAAFLLFVAILNSGLGQLAGTLVLGGMSGLLALELFREGRERPWREGLYALVLALLVTELSWALQYLPMGRIITGLILLLAFYLLSGLMHHHLQGRLSLWIGVEFLLVTAVVLAALLLLQSAGG
ncbi:MAG: hypothetical protein HYY02_11695 [Chloroflexi bacterium]|nr:hypothetical protein [Chloroflexota bacterium]